MSVINGGVEQVPRLWFLSYTYSSKVLDYHSHRGEKKSHFQYYKKAR